MFYLVRQLVKFWFLLAIACFGAYLLIFNQERILITLQGIGNFRVNSAVALLISFFLGVTVVTLYFIGDLIKKSWEIRRLKKRIKKYEIEDAGEKAESQPSQENKAIF